MLEKNEQDRKYMCEAIRLAEIAFGRTSPNPLVGAVIVKGGHVIGSGYHEQAGKPHAEINALNNCSAHPGNAELYVTMEPCCTYGRTPPCTDAIIAAGLRRVVIGSTDPNPLHAGRGVEILRQAGIEVKVGVEVAACDAMNQAFFKWITSRIPMVILKMATTLDGKIATAGGKSQWITGEAARQRVQRLRQWADAVMIGGNTARADHPSLTVRGIPEWRQPRRIVVSRTLSVPEAAALLQPGEEPIVVNPDEGGGWCELMESLGAENISALLIEGGGELAASVLRAGVVDVVEFHYAPKILGGRGSIPVVGGADPMGLDAAFELSDLEVEKAGDDLIVRGKPCRKKEVDGL